MERPLKNEYAGYYQPYIDKTEKEDIFEMLINQAEEMKKMSSEISDEKGNYSYSSGKWSIKEILGHLCDSERIFSNRIVRFARNDKTELPGFEQDDYIKETNFNKRSVKDLCEELYYLRMSNINLFKSFSDEELERTGTANGFLVSVRALIFIIAGHFRHHLVVIKEKYL